MREEEPEFPAPTEKIVQAENEPIEPVQKPENSVAPKIQPNFPNKSYVKSGKRRGRQRAKDRNTADDGVKQLFELWWDEGKGKSFPDFFKDDLSDDMCAEGWGYYPKHYLDVKGKSHAEYLQWRREWRRKFGRKFGSAENPPDPGTAKIIQIRGY